MKLKELTLRPKEDIQDAIQIISLLLHNPRKGDPDADGKEKALANMAEIFLWVTGDDSDDNSFATFINRSIARMRQDGEQTTTREQLCHTTIKS